MDTMLCKNVDVEPTIHKVCLYSGEYKDKDALFLQQVDDLQ